MSALALAGLLWTSSAVARAPRVKPPPDAVQLVVDNVVPTADSHVVFLVDSERDRIVPINVGESEAISIAFRLAGRDHPRPMTHDLLEEALRGLGGQVARAHIHSLEDGVFHATVTVRKKRSLLHLDARASDAIALALGRGLPIWMSTDLYQEAGVSMEDLLEGLRQLDEE